MTALTLLLLGVLLGVLIRRYRWFSLVHPGSWFVVAWVVAFGAYFLGVLAGSFDIYSIESLNDLNLHLVATAAGFFFATFLTKGRTAKSPETIAHTSMYAPGDRSGLLKLFGLVSLAAAILNWIALGANLDTEFRRQAWLVSIPTITARLWYPYAMAHPAALLAGWRIAIYYLTGRKFTRLDVVLLLTPALAGFFWLLGTGGRQAMGIVLLYYACGFVLGWGSIAKRRISITRAGFTKSLAIVLLVVITFAMIVGVTGNMRAEYHGRGSSAFSKYALLRPFGQFIDYMGTSIAYFQVTIHPDSILESSINRGRETFGVLLYLKIGHLLGWSDFSTLDELAAASEQAQRGALFAFSTGSIYWDILADFGDTGGFVVCFLLALVSHYVFVLWLRSTRPKRLLSLIPITITLMFWMYSHQFSILKHDVLKWMIITFLFWDITASDLVVSILTLQKRGGRVATGPPARVTNPTTTGHSPDGS